MHTVIDDFSAKLVYEDKAGTYHKAHQMLGIPTADVDYKPLGCSHWISVVSYGVSISPIDFVVTIRVTVACLALDWQEIRRTH